MKEGAEQELRTLWTKDKKWVLLSCAITLVFVIYGIWNMFHLTSTQWHDRAFKGLYKNYGSQARIILFAVLAYYILKTLLQKRWMKHGSRLKEGAILLSGITRKWHSPLAILAIGLIVLHIIGAFLYEFKLDFAHMSGLVAGVALLPVPIAGVFRYRRLDRRWHMRFGLIFAILFLIHAFL
ncbi:hypothetical protein LJR153_000935 [Paenibacillus sp. LjRoot153]|uniref:hypothetical protein n=1 Tax=Paenibacillus sp. LjRoot153 TaxID=3342270 RepID=UPI003ECF5CD5